MKRVIPLIVTVGALIAFTAWIVPLALVFGLPWVLATTWVVHRGGWDVLIPYGGSHESQAHRVAGFRAGRS